jgi:hypothetical protein
MNHQDDTNSRSRQGRIPATLQAVFLASNRGKDVNKPPPAKVASKIYLRGWLFPRQAGPKKTRGGLFGGNSKNQNESVKKTKIRPKKDAPQVKAVQVPKAKVCKS